MKYLALSIILIIFQFSCKKKSYPDPIEPEPPKEVELTDSSIVKLAVGFEEILIKNRLIADQINDGLVKYGELVAIDSLRLDAKDFGHYNFKSLHGIEYFPNLTYLNIHGSYVDSVDLRKNVKLNYLDCSGISVSGAGINATVKYLNVSGCKNLKSLICYYNKLTDLDLSQNPLLNKLDFLGNDLQKIDISNNINLKSLNSSFNRKITNLNLTKNTHLQYLYCSYNMLPMLDMSMLPDLEELDCSFNWDETLKTFETLDLRNNTKLKYLAISGSRLSSIDLSKNPNIEELTCSSGIYLKSIDLSKLKNLKSLDFQYSIFTEIDLSENRLLEVLDLSGSKINKIDLKNNPNLKKLISYQQQFITELDLRQCLKLELCYTFQSPNLKTICVARLPDPTNFNWKSDDYSQYKICL